MTLFVTSEENQNFIHLDNLLLQWDFKTGHTSLYIVHWIGRQGCLVNMRENMGSNNVNIPYCGYLQYGK